MQVAIGFLGYLLLVISVLVHSTRWRLSLGLLVLAGGVIRISGALDPCLHHWDESFHALVGKNAMAGSWMPVLYPDVRLPHDDGNWPLSHTWLHKPPMTTWSIGASLKLLGCSPFAVRVPSLLLGTIGIYLCFLLGRISVSREVGYWTAFLYAISGHLLELASGRIATDHVDSLFGFLVLAGSLCVISSAQTGRLGFSVLTGLALGAGFLTKSWPVGLLFVVSLAAQVLLSDRAVRVRAKHLVVQLGLAILVAAPWTYAIGIAHAQASQIHEDSLFAHFTRNIEEHAEPWYYYLLKLPALYGELFWLAFGVYLLDAWRSRKPFSVMMLIWFTVPLLVFSIARSKMPGYMVIAAPAVFVITATVIDRWWGGSERSGWLPNLKRVAVAGLILLPIHYSLNRAKLFEERRPEYALVWRDHELGPRDIVLGFPDPTALMFHSDVAAAYENLDDRTIVDLEARGYRFWVYADDGLSRRWSGFQQEEQRSGNEVR